MALPAPGTPPDGYTLEALDIVNDTVIGAEDKPIPVIAIRMKWATPAGAKYCFMPCYDKPWWEIANDIVWWTDAYTQLQIARKLDEAGR